MRFLISSSNTHGEVISYNVDKIILFFFKLTPVWSMHNLLLSRGICFWFCFGSIDCSLYTKSLSDWG